MEATAFIIFQIFPPKTTLLKIAQSRADHVKKSLLICLKIPLYLISNVSFIKTEYFNVESKF